jgi:Holliday junction resolvase RusA-like endonuclease
MELKKEVFIYNIPGKPVALARPRHSGTQVYDSQKREKSNAAIWLAHQHNDRPFLEGPLELTIVFYFEPPKKGRSMTGKLHRGRPDLDNCIKYVCDVANKILYNDDSEIAVINAIKLYSGLPRTEFKLAKICPWRRLYYYIYDSFLRPSPHEPPISPFEDTLL